MSPSAQAFDVIVVGAGVIGAAVARSLKARKAGYSVAVLEKEARPAVHASGRNSGVLHAGFNGKPGSLKAKFCVEGNARLRAFCQERGLPMGPVGTLVAAVLPGEVPVLEELLKRGTRNGVPGLRIIDAAKLLEREPHASGLVALHAPTGAIVSGEAVTRALVEEATSKGCRFFFGERVAGILNEGGKIRLQTRQGKFSCGAMINCAGLYADEVAHMDGVGLDYAVIPFRGEYYRLRPERRGLLNSMLYPVPDLAYPFLGVHWTKTVGGEVLIGPNATIAFGRESYGGLEIGWSDSVRMVAGRHFWKMLAGRDFRRLAWRQLRLSLSRSRFVEEARRLIPAVKAEDFERGQSGNRAQLVDRDGRLVGDMIILRKGDAVHVLNTVSPGLTCALPFADHVVGMLVG